MTEFDWTAFHAHLVRMINFSRQTFGPGTRTLGVTDHISKELIEIRDAWAVGEDTLPEWVDVIILGIDGAWRSQYNKSLRPEDIAALIIQGLLAKQAKNESRTWPDWRTADPDKAIEHDRSKD
jgi:hypothetical protein